MAKRRTSGSRQERAWFLKLHPKLQRVARRRCQLRGVRGQEIDDIAQESILAAWNDRHYLQGFTDGQVLAWVGTVADRTIFAGFRRRRASRVTDSPTGLEGLDLT